MPRCTIRKIMVVAYSTDSCEFLQEGRVKHLPVVSRVLHKIYTLFLITLNLLVALSSFQYKVVDL